MNFSAGDEISQSSEGGVTSLRIVNGCPVASTKPRRLHSPRRQLFRRGPIQGWFAGQWLRSWTDLERRDGKSGSHTPLSHLPRSFVRVTLRMALVAVPFHATRQSAKHREVQTSIEDGSLQFKCSIVWTENWRRRSQSPIVKLHPALTIQLLQGVTSHSWLGRP